MYLGNPASSGQVTISLHVGNANATDDAVTSIIHSPALASQWLNLGPLTADPLMLADGDQVRVRVVSNTGQDSYYPAEPLLISAGSGEAATWPFLLAEAVNAMDGAIRIGVLDENDQVWPYQDSTLNVIYAGTSTDVASAYLQVGQAEPPATNFECAVNYQVASDWNTGFHIIITITNYGNTAIEGYEVVWNFGPGESFSYGWNANFSSNGSTMSASNEATHWNGTIAANGGVVNFGFIGNKNGTPATVPSVVTLNGQICE